MGHRINYMGIPGKPVATVDEIIELMYKHGGKVRLVCKELGCSPRTIYEYIDIYPEVQEARLKAQNMMGDHEIDSAYDVIDKAMLRAEEDMTNALKAAQLVLTKGKQSRYATELKVQEQESISPAQIAAIAGENALLKAKLERLEKKLG